jgi:hypothetical protein
VLAPEPGLAPELLPAFSLDELLLDVDDPDDPDELEESEPDEDSEPDEESEPDVDEESVDFEPDEDEPLFFDPRLSVL